MNMMAKELYPCLIAFLFILACDGQESGSQITPPPTEADRPNIILILADDLGYETLSTNGSQSYQTPNLDALATGGMRFTHAYSAPLCTPTRVQLMTGKYNFRNYVGFGVMKQGQTTIGNLMKDAGYATAIVGKWQLYGNESQQAEAGEIGTLPHEAGFDSYNMWWLYERGGSRFKDPVLHLMGEELQTYPGAYGPDVFADSLLSFAGRHTDTPFFIYFPMALTHAPFQATPDHPDFDLPDASSAPSDPELFKDNVEYMDTVIGRIDSGLDQLGIRENTLILFIGDNGTHRSITSQMPDMAIQGGKGQTTDAGTHVPMIASWPAVITAGQVNSNLVDLTDFLPTLVDAAQSTLPASFTADGISFYNQFFRSTNATTRPWVFCHYAKNAGDAPVRFVHNKTWKLYESGEIYDIENDPEETQVLVETDLSMAGKVTMAEFRDVFDTMK